jgi:N-acetyl-1-D-myo-inositol-2-amino-2-deoxy-alpha-D-glucopyranoside deacetylase
MHAHPDDETIATGATMARYAAAGVAVTLLTSTLGELGEILVPELAGLAAERADQLGGYRLAELNAAMRELGVTDHRRLGGAGRWRDSGMLDVAGNSDPRAFWQCAEDAEAFAEAVGQTVAVMREVQPHVLVTYDRRGGYGHPDHVMTHRVAMAAAHQAAEMDGAGPAWRIAKIYWTVVPGDLPGQEVTTVIEASGWLEAKRAAMGAHATQIVLDADSYRLSNDIRYPLSGRESFRLVHGQAGELDEHGQERDLFAGVGI